MKKLLLIILIGVFIMLKPINAIIKDSIGNIILRGTVVTGIIAIDNGDGSYDVFISEAEEARPNVRTLSANPDLAVGDKVRILYKDGCKERPVIYPPVTAVVGLEGTVFVYYETDGETGYIKAFTSEGEEVTSWTAINYQLMYQGMCVDSSGNVYYIAFTSPFTIVKCDSSGNVLASKVVSYQVQAIAISNDGYIYTLENTQTDNDVMTKRSSETLNEISSFQLDPSHSYYGMAFLNDDRFYVVNSSDDVLEMWKVSTGSFVADVAVDSGKTTLTSLAVAGSTVLGVDFTKDPWYVPTNLGASEIDWSIGITSCLSVASKDGSFYVLGSKSYGGAIFLGKYDESGNEIWEVEVIGATDPKTWASSVAAYPF